MVKHPNQDPQIAQEQILFEMADNPKEQRFNELLFSYGNAAYRYHSDARTMELNTVDLWKEWLTGLPEKVAADFKEMGYEQGQFAIPFTRYVMERSDVGMEAYVKELMGEDEYNDFQKITVGNQKSEEA